MRYIHTDNSVFLQHYGIPGQKWGKRNGPPYPLTTSKMTYREKKQIKIQKSNEKTGQPIEEKKSDNLDKTKQFLIAAGIIGLAAVGSYVAYKQLNNPNSISNSGLPEKWPKDLTQNDSSSIELKLEKQFKMDIEPKLSSSEKQALSDYSFSTNAMDINYYLERDENGNSPYRIKMKNKEMREHFEKDPDRERYCREKISHIDKALDKTITTEDLLVDRKTEFSNVKGMFGNGMSADELGEMLSNPSKAVGRILTQKSYCSTSIDSTANSTFGQCNLHIFVPKGSKGMYIAPISGSPKEKEFLLPRNSKFEITEVRNFSQDPDTIYWSSVDIFLKLIK